MRGKDKPGPVKLAASWIIPACAGKRNSWAVHWTIQRDHPRVCGEKFSSRSSADLRQGSPPRVRGKEQSETGFCSSAGITPAYAGKRPWLAAYCARCGEKTAKGCECSVSLGSPPRMRGKAVEMKLAGTVHGITPAHAGKSICFGSKVDVARDHPRACGEKSAQVQCLPRLSGSPPRMRGKEQLASGVRSSAGITPACAGKRCRSPAFRSMPWDHPRMCREKSPTM